MSHFMMDFMMDFFNFFFLKKKVQISKKESIGGPSGSSSIARCLPDGRTVSLSSSWILTTTTTKNDMQLFENTIFQIDKEKFSNYFIFLFFFFL